MLQLTLQLTDSVEDVSTAMYENAKALAQGGSKQFPTLRFLWVIVATLYYLMLQSWYQKTAQL